MRPHLSRARLACLLRKRLVPLLRVAVGRFPIHADGWLCLELAATVIPEVTGDDLEDAGQGDGQQRPEDAGELNGYEDGDEHRQRVQVDRSGENQRLQQVVLQLLVD